MSACSASPCLLVLLGVVLASGSPTQYVSESLKGSQEVIADRLGLKQPDVGSNPLFSFVIRSLNMSCQRQGNLQVMNSTLGVYMDILSSVLRHQDQRSGLLGQLSDAERSEVVTEVKKQRDKMQRLQHRLNHRLNHKEELINRLGKIEVDDPMVQKKALAEFMEIYQAASVIGFQTC